MTDQQTATSGRPLASLNHVGFVVTDIDAATSCLIDLFGFEALPRKGVMGDPDGNPQLTALFGVNPRAVMNFAFLSLGDAVVELLAWETPDYNPTPPRNSDAGGRHLALNVPDFDAVIKRLSATPGYTVRERSDRGFVYVGTPFGLELQLIPA